MKKWLLNLKLNNLKKNKVNRVNTTYNKAKKIGVIYDSIESYKKHKNTRDLLLNDGKKVVEIVQYKPQKEEKPTFRYFNLNGVSLFGNVNSKYLLDFNKEKFDFLFYFGENYNPLIEFILLKTNTKCRVGYYIEGKEYLFDLMFDKLVSEVKIIEKIKDIKIDE